MNDLNAPIDPLFLDETFDCAGRAGVDATRIVKDVLPTQRGPVSLRDYGHIWFALAREMQDELLGATPFPLRPGGFALMCHSILGAPTPGRALRRALWFLRVVTGIPEAGLSTRNGLTTVTLPLGTSVASPFACRTLLIVLLGPIGWLARRPIPLVQVSFPGPPPMGESAYFRLFGTPVTFDAPALQVSVPAAYLETRINRTEAALKRYLKQAPGNLLVGYHGADDLTGQIRALLSDMTARDWPDFEGVVARFGMSSSTLRRQLRAEGTSYREITAALQLARAKHLLRDSDLPVAAIADLLNYAEPSAFFRAFRLRTGTTPAQYRDTRRASRPTVDADSNPVPTDEPDAAR